MDFRKYLERTAKKLDKEVERILKEQLIKAEKTDKKLAPLLKSFTELCRGGKRIRGALVVLGYEIGKKSSVISRQSSDKTSLKADSEAILKTDSSIIKTAAAYEIAHGAILVHDDIIDQSLLRRDKPSLHQALRPKDGRVEGDHYAISQAISLADYGFFLAFKIISETDFPVRYKTQALGLFAKVMMDTAWGEMLDLEETDPLIVMKLKTAYYTISGPLKMGAVLAGADQKLLGRLGLFGEKLGIAYQIRDDILDAEAEKMGGVNNAEKTAEKCKNQAMKLIPEVTKHMKMSKLLEQMGEYLVQRTK